MIRCVGKCDDPLTLIHSDVIVMGYEDPVLEGENITFTCPTGAILTGPNSSTCAGNGDWEPDARELECSVLVTTTTTIPSTTLYTTKSSYETPASIFGGPSK